MGCGFLLFFNTLLNACDLYYFTYRSFVEYYYFFHQMG